MTRAEAVEGIINGKMLIGHDHPFKNDLLFFNMLKFAAAEKQWYEVAAFCDIQIQILENKQNLDNLNNDIAQNLKDLGDKI
jgi:hypothetical protein